MFLFSQSILIWYQWPRRTTSLNLYIAPSSSNFNYLASSSLISSDAFIVLILFTHAVTVGKP